MLEEKILKILQERRFEGVLQSELLKLTNASKSRISEVLQELENKGKIVRVRESGKAYRVWLKEFSKERVKVGILRATEYVKLTGVKDVEFIVYRNALELTRDLALGKLEFAASPLLTQIIFSTTMKTFKIAGIVAENGSGVVFGDEKNGVFATTEMSAMEMNLRVVRDRLGVKKFSYCDSLECLISGLKNLNGSAIWEPYFTTLEREKIPFNEITGDFPCCSIAVNNEFLNSKIEEVEGLLDAFRRAKPDYSRASKILGFDEEVLKKTAKSYRFNPEYSLDEISETIRRAGFEISRESLENSVIFL